MSAPAYSPCGSTFLGNASATAANVWVVGTQFVNTYKVTNLGNVAVHVRLNANTSSNVTAVFPTVGSPQLGVTINPLDENLIVVPSNLNGQGGQSSGFNSNCQFSYITATGTTQIAILPLVTFS